MAPTRNKTGIAKLPAELLEIIFQHTVTGRPRTLNAQDCDSWMMEDSRAKKEALRLRLVCRQFHDLAWKLLGQILGQTAFNLYSWEHLTNLKTISTRRPLTPWIQKLTLGYYEALCPGEEVLPRLTSSYRGCSHRERYHHTLECLCSGWDYRQLLAHLVECIKPSRISKSSAIRASVRSCLDVTKVISNHKPNCTTKRKLGMDMSDF